MSATDPGAEDCNDTGPLHRRGFIRLEHAIFTTGVEQSDELLGLYVRIRHRVNFRETFHGDHKVHPGQLAFNWRELPELLYSHQQARPSKNTLIKRMEILEALGAIHIDIHESKRFSILTVNSVPNFGTVPVSNSGTVPSDFGTVPGTVPGTVLGTVLGTVPGTVPSANPTNSLANSLSKKGKKGKKDKKGKNDKNLAQESFSDELNLWIDWWNELHTRKLVHAGTRSSEANTKSFRRAKANPELLEILSDRSKLEKELQASDFVRGASWLTLARLLSGKNQQGEYIAQRLADGGYRSGKAKPSYTAGANYDPTRGTTNAKF